MYCLNDLFFGSYALQRGGRNRTGRREKWPKQNWEEGEIGGKSREEGEKEKLGVGRIELDGPGCGNNFIEY